MVRRKLWIENTGFWRALVLAQKSILIGVCAFSALLVTVNVLCRYIIKIDVFALDEIIKLVTMWMYFIGAGFCSHVEGHINANLIGPMLKSGKIKKALKLFTEVLTLFALTFFLRLGWQYTLWALKMNGKTPGLGIPLFASQVTLFVGIALMFMYTLVRFIGYIKTPVDEYVSNPEEQLSTIRVSEETGEKEEAK